MNKRYIDAEKMQSHLEEKIEGCGYPISDNNPIAFGTTLGLKMALRYAKTLPTADVAPVVHAKWMGGGGLFSPYCSNCKKYSPRGERFNYCPHCGARMDEEKNEK